MAGWIVKRDGSCSKCGTLLRAGTEAVWKQQAHSMVCLNCALKTSPTPIPSPIDPGVAGHSARLKHQQLVAKREVELKAQWGDRIGGWVTKLADEPSSTQAWAIGAAGEERLGRILDGLEGIAVLHDRRIPGSRANIDHIAVAPAGIFVIDTKHYQGRVEIRHKGSIFHPEDRLYVGRWDRTEDADGVKAQVAVVESVLYASSVGGKASVTPVLCFTRADWALFGAAKSFAGVNLESDRSIRSLVRSAAHHAQIDILELRDVIGRALPSR